MDLKALREGKLKMKTQEEFAQLLDVSVTEVEEWETNPNVIPFTVVTRITAKTGLTFEEVTSYERPKVKPLVVDNSWSKAAFTKQNLTAYISDAIESSNILEGHKEEYINGLKEIVVNTIRKPRIAFVGRSDTGKSTLINTLLGVEKMPTSWTPTTSIAVYLKHISERPEFIKDDIWIFSSQVGNETQWDVNKLSDEEYCTTWKIASGEIGLLHSYGIRQGENYDKRAGAAVIFIDSPALINCDIIDLPGFGTETESDDNITTAVAGKADIIIYLSQANGFMRIEDITYLKRNIKNLPVWEKQGESSLAPLANLFVVASQAHTVNCGNRSELNTILDKGCTNLLKTLDDNYWDKRESVSGYRYTNDVVRSRFFAFSTDIPDLCAPFMQQLKQVLEDLPIIVNKNAKEQVRHYIEGRMPNLLAELQKYEGIISESEKYAALLTEIDKNELSRIRDSDEKRKDVLSLIEELRIASKRDFVAYIATIVDIDTLVEDIKASKIKNKKEDLEQYVSKLQSKIEHKCEYILDENSKIISEKAAEYVKSFSDNITCSAQTLNIDIDFDAAWVFGAALSAFGLVGGLGIFLASTISGAVFFSGLGIGLGTSLLWGAMTASIFGPIGMLCGLILAIGMAIFGGSWEKSVAKKIVERFEENKIVDKYCEGIDQYWDQTKAAFERGAEDLEKNWRDYVDNLRKMVNSSDIEALQQNITSIKNTENFFKNIQL